MSRATANRLFVENNFADGNLVDAFGGKRGWSVRCFDLCFTDFTDLRTTVIYGCKIGKLTATKKLFLHIVSVKS
jgi:hypothetical protein